MSFGKKAKKIIKMNLSLAGQAVFHPRTRLVYYGNPSTVRMSPAPWYISIICIFLGTGLWCLSVHFQIEAMAEAGRLLLYGGIGNILGINLGIKQAQVSKGIKD